MPFDLRSFAPGTMPDAVFVELIAGTKIESETLTAALRDHLVHGLTKTVSAQRHGVNQSQFSKRLKSVMADAQRIGRIVALLEPPTPNVDEVIALAGLLMDAAHRLKNAGASAVILSSIVDHSPLANAETEFEPTSENQ